MTVHIANDAGMDNVVRTFERMGIGKYETYLSFALGAGDTTVLKMVNAYSGAGQPRAAAPADADRLRAGPQRQGDLARRQARLHRLQHGRVGRQADAAARAAAGKQVLDPRTAYQVVHMLEGVVQRGTAVRAARPRAAAVRQDRHHQRARPTRGSSAASPDIIAGVYIGYDKPRSISAARRRAATSPRRSSSDFVKATKRPLGRSAVRRPRGRAHGADRPPERQAGVRRRGRPTIPRLRSSGKRSSPIPNRARATRQDEVAAKRERNPRR